MPERSSLLSGFDKERLARYTLTVSLLLYAAVCPVSKSATYFPLFLTVASALLIRLGLPQRPLFSRRLKWLGVSLFLLSLWQCITVFVNKGELTPSPFLRAFDFLPVFVLAEFPFEASVKKKITKAALFLLFSVTALIIAAGMYQGISGVAYPFPIQPFSDGKLLGLFSHHIPAGGFFSTLSILSLCLVLFWKIRTRTKVFLGILFFMFLSGTVLSLSRTYFVSLLVTLPLVLIRRNLRIGVAGMTALALFLSITMASLPTVRNRAVSILDLKSNPSNVERLYLWKVAGDMIADRPLLGVGFKQWGERISDYSGKYSAEWKFSPASLHHAHNAYLHVAAETGLMGLLLSLGFWLSLLRATLETARLCPDESFAKAMNLGSSFALVNLFIGGFFEENLGTLVIIFLISLVTALSLFVADGTRVVRES